MTAPSPSITFALNLLKFLLFFIPFTFINSFLYYLYCVFVSCSMFWPSWVFFPTVLLSCKLTLALEDENLQCLGFWFHRSWVSRFLLGAIVGLVLYLAFFGLAVAVGLVDFHWATLSWTILAPLAFASVRALLTALTEELVFRGFLMYILSASWNRAVAVLISAVLFAFLHLYTHNLLDLSWLFTFGLVAGLVRLKSGSLWPSIGLHAGFQMALVILEILIFDSRLRGSIWALEGLLTVFILCAGITLWIVLSHLNISTPPRVSSSSSDEQGAGRG